MAQRERNNKDLILKTAPIVLAIISIALLVYFNYPSPRIEVDWFLTGLGVSKQMGSYGQIAGANGSQLDNYFIPVNVTERGGKEIYFYNWTFQAINSGKGVATGVKMTIVGEPSDRCRVSSTTIYSNEPTPSNLLGVTRDTYVIGIMEAGKRYIFAFQVEVEKESGSESKFVIEITSNNHHSVSLQIAVP